MKKLIFILAAVIVSTLSPAYSAVPAEVNEYFSLLAEEINSENLKAVWNGSDLVISTLPDEDFDDVVMSQGELKELKKAFAEGFLSTIDKENLDVIKGIMRDNNIHMIINLMGTKSKAASITINWNDLQ